MTMLTSQIISALKTYKRKLLDSNFLMKISPLWGAIWSYIFVSFPQITFKLGNFQTLRCSVQRWQRRFHNWSMSKVEKAVGKSVSDYIYEKSILHTIQMLSIQSIQERKLQCLNVSVHLDYKWKFGGAWILIRVVGPKANLLLLR